jgi:hypothetical protein
MSDEQNRRRPPEDFSPEAKVLWYESEIDALDAERHRDIADLQARLDALKTKIERGEAPAPKAIHPQEFKRILRRGGPLADRVHRAVQAKELAVSTDMPDGAFETAHRKALPKIHVIELLKMPLSRYEETMRRAQAGELEIVSE